MATSIRGREWAFNIFWAGSDDPQTPKCSIYIPFTCMFKSGSPIKSVYSDPVTGVIKKISLENVPPVRDGSERGFRGESFKLLSSLRRMLIEYSSKSEYDKAQKARNPHAEPFLCKVLFTLPL